MNPELLEQLKQKLSKVMEVINNDLGTIRTGRANTGLVENIFVNAYEGSALRNLRSMHQQYML